MPGSLQSRLNPPSPPVEKSLSDATINSGSTKAIDSTELGRTSFQDLLQNSNAEQSRVREAQKNGDLKGAKTDEEFANSMKEKLNKDNARVPTSNLDKDAFLKLFIIQMQNQDPLNPQESTEMASQLAQFHSLEQMLNVNKNLEAMAAEQSTSRAVSLINFVGKEIRIQGGKLNVDHGKFTSANYSAERDIPSALLEIRDASGTVVGTKNLGALKAGENKLPFDGSTDKGALKDGLYTFSIVGKDVQGIDVPIAITSSVKVTGVDLTDQGGSFYTEIGKVRVHEIATVGDMGFQEIAATKEVSIAPGDAPTSNSLPEQSLSQTIPDIAPAIKPSAASSNKTAEDDFAKKSNEDKKTISATSTPTAEILQDEAPPTVTQRKPQNPYNPYASSDGSNLTRPPETFMPRRI